MQADDVLAVLASRPKRERPTELRSDSAMLSAWLRLRKDRDFIQDVLVVVSRSNGDFNPAFLLKSE